ncbi:MAG: hypothetical protein DMD72_05910 [Gemmatimonadetes bacterium]|nr:MAG: hypothetical protein DMD72_05910 [Gemmatimonadota bacterium]
MRAISLILRVVALTFVLFVCFSIGSGIAMRGIAPPSSADGSAAISLVVVCALETIVVSYLILRSRWAGWRLMLAIFVVFYGVSTFMGQSESVVFLTQLPAGMVPRLFLMGFLTAAPFSVLAVIILGKRNAHLTDHQPNTRLIMPASEWGWKLAVIAVAYVILYFTFGYFIAWRNPAVREYYGGADPGSFLAQMGNVARDRPWLIPFQVLRALCWAAIALPVIRMLQGEWHETAFALGITFAVLMNAQLLLPNPYMPEPVRMAHLVETASSNFIFGLLIGWLLTEHRAFAKLPAVQSAA